MNDVAIRLVSMDDAEELLKIYAYYVEHTAVSFEYDVPAPAEFRKRIARTLTKYPYFVAESEEGILGYAYAGPFVGRAAYGWSAELTIYLAPDRRGRGLGRKLYGELEAALAEMGITNLYACIGLPEEEDEYLTRSSADFHAHMGFAAVGTFRRCGRKFQRWYDMIWMEKIIGEHGDNPPVRRFSETEYAREDMAQ